jgi:type I restriction enzyme R subunit
VGGEAQNAERLAKDIEAEDNAHVGSGLSPGAYGILQIINSFSSDAANEDLAGQIAGLYADEATAPSRWQDKDGLRKSLRQKVRGMAHGFGLSNLKELSEQVEEFAVKYFARM